MITSGPLFTTEGGHPASTICAALWSEPDLDGPDPYCRSHFTREVTELNEAREAVRQLAEEGGDYIKVVSDSINAPVQIDEEIVEAIVEEAHRQGLRTVGHVYEAEHMESYAKMGMDGFVHPVYPATISGGDVVRFANVLAKEGTPVTTTLSVVLLIAEDGVSDEQIEAVLEGDSSAREVAELIAREMATFTEAGVPVVVGTDWWSGLDVSHPAVQPGAVTITEMQMLRWGGMSHEDIIQAATANAAEALDMGDEIGMLEEGKLADLIVVDGNPLEDLSALENVEIVVQGGKIVASNSQ